MFNETAISNPFPGLRSFEENEDILFFGREKQIDELLRKLRTVRFLAVIGSSGSGKSSLVKSGLIPALYSGFMSGAGSSWKICTFRPGVDPIGNMAKALAKNDVLYEYSDPDDELTHTIINETILRRSNFGLVEAYKQSGIQAKNNLLILVDQFEELFRFSRLEKDAREGKRDSIAFINLLLKATEQREYPIYVVFTMRSDFLADCTEFHGLPEAINEGQYLVPRMTWEERKEAIAGPVAVGGADISPRLLNQLLNDVGDNPDQLPILQHALMRTWDTWLKKARPEEPLDLVHYEEIGTMSHALSQHAEEAYDELGDERQKAVCEQIFKAITDKGSETRGIRRPTRLGELCKMANASLEECIAVIEVFRKPGRAFLMPPAEVPLAESSVIDISHESLMRVWERLILWVEEESQSAQVYTRLCEAANLYELGKGSLWRDPELQIAWKWKEESNPNATWASRYNSYFEKAILFLDYSKQQYEQELAHKEKMQKARLRRARRIAAFISLVALAAFILAIYAFALKSEANKQRKLAEDQKAIAEHESKEAKLQRQNALDQKQKAEANWIEALNQKKRAEEEGEKARKSERNALLQKAIAEQQKSIAESQRQLAVQNANLANQQKQIAENAKTEAQDNEKQAIFQKKVADRLKNLSEARNLAYQSLLRLNEGKKDESRALAMQAYTLNADNDGPQQNNDIYNALHFNWQDAINNKNEALIHKGVVRALAVSPTSSIIFSGDEEGIIRISKADGAILTAAGSYNLKEPVRQLSVSPDGSTLLALTDKSNAYILKTNANSLEPLAQFHFDGIGKNAVFTASGSFILLTSQGAGSFSINGEKVSGSLLPADSILAIAYGSSGKLYAAARKTIMVYNSAADFPASPSRRIPISFTATCLNVSPKEQYLAAGTSEGAIWLRSLGSDKAENLLPLHRSAINDLQFVQLDNKKLQLASASYDQTIKLIDVASAIANANDEDIISLRGHSKWIYALRYTPDGKYLYSASEDKKIIGWCISTQEIAEALKKEESK